ncbi:uncharacterized protein LOC126738792 [Anthonomus grandis grandis]|uniref:uncharacterized protein LOC126738792 n=1 Tax=Anthonomus grandis grandis TaxID=2921223 RepID=UPI0021659B08|nr:uncharacterized protein LOC126738792 [Anthonomus grandis grandis]
MLRTIIKSKVSSGNGIIDKDQREKHGNYRKLDEEILQSIIDHINSIPRIESHYVRSETTREFIDGGLSIAELHRNYSAVRSADNKNAAASYDYYAQIFNTKFNIGFRSPKKDQCDLCEMYKQGTEEKRKELETKYCEHLEEKLLSRQKKDVDKQRSKDHEIVLAVYDLQAVLPVPIGQTSAFFYKSRLNCYNFTVTEITNDKTKVYFWHEYLGNRGAIEIGTCVLLYLKSLSERSPGVNVVFYSDNCMGQQKNRFLIAVYLYAVEHFEIMAITHKYLIRGHTQNEGDAIHSAIEKQISKSKKSGAIYVPEQYVYMIREAKKKGNKIDVQEMGFENFLDIKALFDDMGLSIAKNDDGDEFKINVYW